MTISIAIGPPPTGKSTLDLIEIQLVFGSAPTFASVGLFQGGIQIVGSAVDLQGLNGSAFFRLGHVAAGTYEIRVLAGDGSDTGQVTGGASLVVDAIDPTSELLYSKFREALRQTLRDSPLITIPDDCIIINRWMTEDEDDLDPGIVIARADPAYTTERKTTNGKDYTFHAMIITTTKHNLDDELDDDDRRAIEGLTGNVEKALEENRFLGYLDFPLMITPVNKFLLGSALAHNFDEAILVSGLKEFIEI